MSIGTYFLFLQHRYKVNSVKQDAVVAYIWNTRNDRLNVMMLIKRCLFSQGHRWLGRKNRSASLT